MRPSGSQEQLERRRRRAVAMREHGYGPSEIAKMLNTTPQSVCRWVRLRRRQGDRALVSKPVPGRPSKLNARQKRALGKCLLKGASAFDFDTDTWTYRQIRQLIEQRYGISYHEDHIPRLLASLGLSLSEA